MLRILHLSDIHFGTDPKTGKCVHHFQNGGVTDPGGLARVLQKDALLGDPPDAIVLSGDIGWSGCADDYAHALNFVEQLRGRWSTAQIILAPGNHDVVLGAPSDAAQSAYAEFVAQVHKSQLQEHYPFWNSNLSHRERLVQVTTVDKPGNTALFVSVIPRLI